MSRIASVRNYSIAIEFLKYFDTVSVLTTRYPPFNSLFELNISRFRIIKVFHFDYISLATLLNKNNNLISQANAHSESFLIQFARKCMDSFPTNILFGEGSLFYIIGGIIRGVSHVKKDKITHIYSSYRTYSDHLIARGIKFFCPNLYWIADFQDMHVDINRSNVYLPAFQHWCNRKIVAKANIVTTVSKGFADYLKKYKCPVEIIYFGINDFFKDNEAASFYEKFTISYTGSLYPSQTANPLFYALNSLIEKGEVEREDVQIVYAGKDSLMWNSWVKNFDLSDLNADSGLTSEIEARRIQQKSHISLVLSWAGEELKGIVPAKVFSYLNYSYNILWIINGVKDDEPEELLHDAGVHYKIVYNDEEGKLMVEEYIKTLYAQYKKNQLSVTSRDLNPNQERLKIESQVASFVKKHLS